MQLNEVIYAGHLGKDAHVHTTQNGMCIVTLSVAHTFKTKDGKEITTWLNCKTFSPWADTAKEFKKGDNVMVKGRLQETTWKDKETGAERRGIEVVCGAVARFLKTERPPVSAAPTPTATKQPDLGDVFGDIPF